MLHVAFLLSCLYALKIVSRIALHVAPGMKGRNRVRLLVTEMYRFFFIIMALFFIASCSSAPSTVESAVQRILTGEEPEDETYAGQQHFPVTPQEAVDFLVDVAPRHGWEVVSTGDEYDAYRKRGKFFRLEADEAISGKKVVSGVFYEEGTGAYVRISENNGLPETLVDPLIAEIKEKKGYR